MKQLTYETITDKRSVPFNSPGTGTCSTRGVAINGLGTLFSTEMQAGSCLVNLSTNEAIKVIRVDSNTKAFLEKPFLADMTAITPQIIAKHKVKAKKIKLVTAAANFINGKPFTGTFEIDKLGNSRSGRPDLIDPIVVDSTTGPTIVEIDNY